MNRKHTKGWLKHGDFILLDIVVLQLFTFSAFYYDGKNYVSNGGGVASEVEAGWTKKGNYWFYVKDDVIVINTAVQNGKTWYAFDEYGRMLDNEAAKIGDDYYRAKVNGALYVNEWFTDTNGDRYYYGEEGIAVTGRVVVDGIEYTFDETGCMK